MFITVIFVYSYGIGRHKVDGKNTAPQRLSYHISTLKYHTVCSLLHSPESWVLPLEKGEKSSHVPEKVCQNDVYINIVIAFIIIRVSVIHFSLLRVRQTTENTTMVKHLSELHKEHLLDNTCMPVRVLSS